MGQYRGRSDNNEIGKILDEIGKLEMLKDLSIKLIADEDEYADKIAHTLRNMKTAQLRRFFGAIKLIERTIEEENSEKAWDDVEAEFYLLRNS